MMNLSNQTAQTVETAYIQSGDIIKWQQHCVRWVELKKQSLY
ncbi:hypothetical protein OKW24_001214 [Peribacillus simplex]|nr:hypothetical protein [Peribacillus simplex]MDF9759441.1 hypothetical protein [Peribacillus simplex]